MNNEIKSIDFYIISFMRRYSMEFARIALFVVYFWFGALKIFDKSPANPLVASLLAKTLPFMSFGTFIMILGIVEMFIGLCFLIPRLERIGFFFLVLHLITTIMPLFLLPTIAWSGFFVPTLEGQYIIKNIVIIALACFIITRTIPFSASRN